jgi:hypothetical protein
VSSGNEGEAAHAVAASRKHHTAIGLTVGAVVLVAVHLGLGGALLSAPWTGWVAGVVVAIVALKIAVVTRLLRKRRRRSHVNEEPIARAEARVPTPKAERYAKQLCGHAAWKAARAEWTAPHGVIEFPEGMGTCRITAEPADLLLTVEATGPANLARIQRIIGGNIERFASRDGLTVEWAQG